MEKIEIRDLRKKEQFILDDAFLNGYAKFVGVYAVGVYCSLCRHADKAQTSWPSLETIAAEIDIGRNTVIEAVKRLEFWGIIVKVRVGKMANNRYILPDKKTWKLISEVHLKDYSEVCRVDFTSLRDKLHQSTTRTSNSKEPQIKETQVRLPAAELPYDVKEDDLDKPTKSSSAKYPHSKEVFAWFPRPQKSWEALKNVREREAAEYLHERGEVAVKKMLGYLQNHEGEEFLPSVTKPSDLERKWEDIRAYAKRN